MKIGGRYYVRWFQNGERFVRQLSDDAGNPIKNVEAAETAKVKFMAPFRVADKAAALESIAVRLGGTVAAVAVVDDLAHPPLKVVDAWKAFVDSPRRPDCGASTLGGYEVMWSRFVEWMEGRRKGAALRDVDEGTAALYA